jgi:uncharacterized membrane protein
LIGEPLAVFTALAAIVLVAVVLERRSRLVAPLGSVLTAIVLGALLGNLGVLPAVSSAYDALGGIGVNLAIALVLLGVNVETLWRAGPRMLGAFLLGAVGTAAGALAGAALLSGAIGPETWKLAGQYTGTYTGGGVNFVAVGQAVGTSPTLFTAAVAADNVTTALWMAGCLAIPSVLGGWWWRSPAARVRPADPAATARHDFIATAAPVTLQDAAAVVTAAAGVVWLSGEAAAAVPGVPQVLWLTTLALALAQARPLRRCQGGPLFGNYVLHLFLAGLGAQSIVREIASVGPAVFYFTLIVVGVHAAVLFGLGRALRLDLPTLTVASQANIGGPGSALALATAKGYAEHVVPGLAVGILGYAVGNYLGLFVAGLARSSLGAL